VGAGFPAIPAQPVPPIAGQAPTEYSERQGSPSREIFSRHKKTRQWRVFSERSEIDLGDLNFFSLHAFLAAGSDESNSLAFFQGFEAVSLDGFEVHEQVVARLRVMKP
jgi:hypothetical protein